MNRPPRTSAPASSPQLPLLCARRSAAACAAALLLLAAPGAFAEPIYNASLLALPEASTGSRAFGLSGGVVVGQVTGSDGLPHAVMWADPNAPQLVNAGPFESSAMAIAGSTVVGVRGAAAKPAEFEALSVSAGAAPTVLGNAGGGAAARAAAAQFVAGSQDRGAFVYNSLTAAMTLFDAPGAVAHGVNAAGVAVGQNAAGLPVAFNGGALAGFIDVLGAAGDASGSAQAVLGDQVVGFFDDPETFQQVAFLAKLGQAGGTRLFAGSAFGLNAAGDVVGADFDAGLAMLYRGGTAYDLNQLVGAGLGDYKLTQARAIDEQGRIVAFGVDANGNERAFLLSPAETDPEPPQNPVPAPASLLLVATALTLLRLRR